MENIFDVPKSVFVEMHFLRQIETKKNSNKIYISINSIKICFHQYLLMKNQFRECMLKRK